MDTGYGGRAPLQRYLLLVTYMGNGGFLCGLWANGIDRELKGGGKGLEMDIYTYIYIQSAELLSIDPRRMWRPTEVTPKERERKGRVRE